MYHVLIGISSNKENLDKIKKAYNINSDIYVKKEEIKNNEFMLALIDPDLENINPHDPHLNAYYKQKVLRECMCNYW